MILEADFIHELHSILQQQTMQLLFEEYGLQTHVSTARILEREFYLPQNAFNSVINLQSIKEVWIALCIDNGLHQYLFEQSTKGLFIPDKERRAYQEDFVAEFQNLIVGHTLAFIKGHHNRIGIPKLRLSEAAIQRLDNVMVSKSEIETVKGSANLFSIIPAVHYNQNLEKLEESYHV